MEWTLYRPHLSGETMFKLGENINHLVLVMIIGVVSLAVTKMDNIAQSLQVISMSVQELNVKVGWTIDGLKDHELRLREIETANKKQNQGR